MAEKKPHEADVYQAQQIARADKFSAVIQLGPHNRRYAEGMTSYAEALEGAALLNAESKFGRRAVIYAHTPEGRAFPVDIRLAKMAGLVPECFEKAR